MAYLDDPAPAPARLSLSPSAPVTLVLVGLLGVGCSDDTTAEVTTSPITTETSGDGDGDPSGDGDGDPSGDGDGDGDPATGDGDPTGDGDGDPTGDGDGDPTGDGDGDQPLCGNSVVDPGEECDVGNETMFCDGDCTFSVCGDGYHNMLGEQCDDGNELDDDACVGPCLNNTCGDGYVYAGVEECDDDNLDDDDDCTSACVAAFCGDGIVHAEDEECDDANMIGTDACTDVCTASFCGDGVLWEGVETCDDGNLDDTDACPGSCEPAVCGDGFTLLGVEDCDDGNMVDDDGCSNTCVALELGILLGGTNFDQMEVALDDMGLIYEVENSQWLAPNSASILIMSNDGGDGEGLDYDAHFNAGRHVLMVGGTSVQLFRDWVAGYFAITDPGGWHQSNDCMGDWSVGDPHPMTANMPEEFEFANDSASYHMLHFNDLGQPMGVTALGDVCHGAPNDHILVTRSFPGGGTMTYMAFDVGNFGDPATTMNFMVPWLEGYFAWVASL